MSREPNRNVYVGHRYVPKIMGEWDKKISYEGLSIVLNEGHSYTSKGYVPVGIDIKNKEFWALTGNYNAQVEHYRQEVSTFDERLNVLKDDTDTNLGNINDNLNVHSNKLNTHENLIEKNETDITNNKEILDNEVIDLNNKISDRVSKGELLINVKDFGALGDGVKDDTVSVVNALNSVDPHQTLYFPYGTYNLSNWETYNINKEIRILGENNKGTVIKGNTDTDFLNIHNSLHVENMGIENFSRVFRWNDEKYHGEDLSFINNRIINTGNVLFSYAENTRVKNVTFAYNYVDTKHKGNGVLWQAGVENFNCHNNYFINIQTRAVHVGNNSLVPVNTWNKIRIFSNNISDVLSNTTTSPYGIIVYGSEVSIYNNFIEDVYFTNDTGDCEGIYTKCRNLIVTNNTLKNAGSTEGSIVIKNSITTHDLISTTNKIVSYNVIDNSKQNTLGITISSSDTMVIGNRINGCNAEGILVSGANFTNIIIKDNVITNGGNAGIRLWTNGDDNIISNNVIENTVGYGIYIEPVKNTTSGGSSKTEVKNWVITGNQFKKNQTGLSIRMRDSDGTPQFKNLKINNNVFTEADNYGLEITANANVTTEGLLIENNIFNENTKENIRRGSSGIDRLTDYSINNNTGFRTKDKGNIEVPLQASGVSVVFDTDLTPSFEDIKITPTSNLKGKSYWVSSISSNTFRIALEDGAQEEGISFSWVVDI